MLNTGKRSKKTIGNGLLKTRYDDMSTINATMQKSVNYCLSKRSNIISRQPISSGVRVPRTALRIRILIAIIKLAIGRGTQRKSER